jgi:hypothetical protein
MRRTWLILVIATAVGVCGCHDTGHLVNTDTSADTCVEDGVVDDDEGEQVWVECAGPDPVDARIEGPREMDVDYEVTIDGVGSVDSVIEGEGGRTVIQVDFSTSDPELGIQQFELPAWVRDVTDLGAGDEIRVEYHWEMWFFIRNCLRITRDGNVLIEGFANDGACQDFFDVFSWQLEDLTFENGTSDCEPRVDDCATWQRRYYDVSCSELESPVLILDASEADVPCGPGYHVVLSEFVERGPEPILCTDTPYAHVQVLAVRQPD